MGGVSVSLIYFAFVAMGYQAVLAVSTGLIIALKIMGALFLIYLGVKSLKNQKNKKQSGTSNVQKKTSYLKDYSLGFFMAIPNPITIFYYVGILPGLVPVGEMQFNDVLIGMGLILLVCVVVDGLLILLTVMTKEAFLKDKMRQYIGNLASFSFILIGIYLLYAAIFLSEGLVYNLT